MKKIAIFQSDLMVGGIQKALVNLLDSVKEMDYEVDVYLNQEKIFYNFVSSNNIKIHYLKGLPFFCRFIYFDILKKLVKTYNIDKEYDLAIDFSSYQNECALGAINCNAKKKVMWIHNDVNIKLNEEPKYRILHNFFNGKHKYYDGFVAVSEGIVEPFKIENKIFNKPIYVMPNIINTQEIIEKSLEDCELELDEKCINVASMGRLCHQKGFDLLLDDFAKAVEINKNLRLYILGDGPDKHKIEHQINELKLNGYVTLLGNQRNPYKFLRKMDAFVLTSRYEGQGIVLWEAKALGLSLVMPKRLEKYNYGLCGVDDVVMALCSLEKQEKKIDDLKEYNKHSLEVFESLVE